MALTSSCSYYCLPFDTFPWRQWYICCTTDLLVQNVSATYGVQNVCFANCAMCKMYGVHTKGNVYLAHFALHIFKTSTEHFSPHFAYTHILPIHFAHTNISRSVSNKWLFNMYTTDKSSWHLSNGQLLSVWHRDVAYVFVRLMFSLLRTKKKRDKYMWEMLTHVFE